MRSLRPLPFNPMKPATVWKIILVLVLVGLAMLLVNADPELRNDAVHFLRSLVRALF